ncbi:MAG TPA: serine/threonine-protein kinase, partial [Pirellulaceae bacterium]|nr:serine/threonine-protein kinase [Pirellulaceae bacterium]
MTSSLTPENATQAWDELARRLEEFMEAWGAAPEPPLADFLPEAPPVQRRMVLIELIKIDLEHRTDRGLSKQLESYTSEHPELLENGEPPCELIYEEYHIRRSAGLTVTPQHYYDRFPKSAGALKRLMGTEGLSQTTQLVPAKRITGIVPGQRLDDFDLLVELGKGAFASVFLARQISMGRLVALKVSADKGNEPRMLAAFDHPNIVRVFDQRQLPDRQVRLLFMQFAPGGTLADVVREVRATPPSGRSGKMLLTAVDAALAKSGTIGPDDSTTRRRIADATWPETVCRLGVQLAQALDHAHKKDTLHRDVKPANVLLSAEGSPKLADFNISFSSQIEGVTAAAYFGGSLAYMSPEQLEACNPNHDRRPDELDGRSDLFSLAVVLWELLHGERPFADEAPDGGWSQMLAGMAHRRRDSVALPKTKPGDPVEARLDQVLRKALSPDPAQRHADGAALARDLLLCLNPRAWDLVHNMTSGWRDFARREPMALLVPAVLPPFIFAGLFNLSYNLNHFIQDLINDPKLNYPTGLALVAAFWFLVIPINAVLYPLGIGLVWWFAAPLARCVRKVAGGGSADPEELQRARARAISLGHVVAAFGLGLWVVAGLAFPIGMNIMVGVGRFDIYAHFFLAMFISGVISCCLPFLATTWLSIRVFFPALLAGSAPNSAEHRRLQALSRYAGWYMWLSPVGPLGAIFLIVISGGETQRQ